MSLTPLGDLALNANLCVDACSLRGVCSALDAAVAEITAFCVCSMGWRGAGCETICSAEVIGIYALVATLHIFVVALASIKLWQLRGDVKNGAGIKRSVLACVAAASLTRAIFHYISAFSVFVSSKTC
jgi:hypothetical protein